MRARPSSFRLSCLPNAPRSCRPSRRRNSFAGGWNACSTFHQSASHRAARISASAAAATTNTFPTKRNSSTKLKSCARLFAASAASNGPAKSRSTLRNRGIIATARNGKFVRSKDSSADEASPAELDKLGIGYFRANSTALCAVSDCPILSPLLLKTLLALRDALAADALPRQLREFEAFSNSTDSKLLLTATFAGFPPRAAELAEKIRTLAPEIESLLFHDPARERMELFGPGFIEYEAGGQTFRVGHFSFFQVNNSLVDELVRDVADRDEGGRLALDLFAGVGLFATALAQKFDRVVAVEANPAAARDLETNARGGPIEVRASDVERFLERFKEKPEFVVLDPPRDGMARPALDRLGRIQPARVAYVSCEPPTLARDLAVLVAAGYEIVDMHLFDLFPQTFHMEAVTRLRRRE